MIRTRMFFTTKAARFQNGGCRTCSGQRDNATSRWGCPFSCVDETGADMRHDPKVTRLYSLRKPAPNVAAFGRAGEGHTGALALIFIDVPRMSHKGKALAAHVRLGSFADPDLRLLFRQR